MEEYIDRAITNESMNLRKKLSFLCGVSYKAMNTEIIYKPIQEIYPNL